MRDLDALYPYKHSIIDDLYIKTADDNYVAARWCFSSGLDVDFFWLAVHCLEKYLKAALLLNERPAKTYGHDIESLYKDVYRLSSELLPVILKVPEGMPRALLSLGDESTDKFIRRLYLYGQPDNRYLFNGYIRRGSDIVKFDQLVFSVRRLCQPLEAHFLGRRLKNRTDIPSQTRRERMVQGDPSSRNLHSNLEKIMGGERGKYLQRILLNWNFSFAPRDYKHGRMAYEHRVVNPVLVRRLLDPLEAGKPEQDKHADDLWAWAKENIYFSREFVRTYEAARTKRKTDARSRKAH